MNLPVQTEALTKRYGRLAAFVVGAGWSIATRWAMLGAVACLIAFAAGGGLLLHRRDITQ